MTNEDKILNYLKSVSPKRLSNPDISKATGIRPHQQVFQITNLLLNKDQIEGIREGHTWKFWYEIESNKVEGERGEREDRAEQDRGVPNHARERADDSQAADVAREQSAAHSEAEEKSWWQFWK